MFLTFFPLLGFPGLAIQIWVWGLGATKITLPPVPQAGANARGKSGLFCVLKRAGSRFSISNILLKSESKMEHFFE